MTPGPFSGSEISLRQDLASGPSQINSDENKTFMKLLLSLKTKRSACNPLFE